MDAARTDDDDGDDGAARAVGGAPPLGDPREWALGRLLSTAARMVERDWNTWLADHDLTHAGLVALHALDDGPLTQRQLASASRVQEQTMSRVLDRLERSGHVTRHRDDHDRRRLVVSRTPQGDGVFAHVEGTGAADALVASRLADPRAFREELLRLLGPERPTARG